MNDRGEQVHGIAFLDGASHGGVATLLFLAGSTTARTIAETERLSITDLMITDETGADVYYDFDTDDDDDHDAGDIIFAGSLAAKQVVTMRFDTPRQGPAGATPKLYGANAATIASAIIQGFITKA